MDFEVRLASPLFPHRASWECVGLCRIAEPRTNESANYFFFASLHSGAAFLAFLASSTVGYDEVPIMTLLSLSFLFEILQLLVLGFRILCLLPPSFSSQPHTWPPAISKLDTSGLQYSAYSRH